MKTSIVIGLGFGDEGKGLVTDYLCKRNRQPWVVRFNGGHQAGHTVVTAGGKRHVFSSLGSGSLAGAPTYWSKYCSFYPPGFLEEYKALEQLGVRPGFYIDAQSPVTTLYDVIYNRSLEQSRNPHGSCGLGFGATIERHEMGCRLVARDLLSARELKTKLKKTSRYYDKKIKEANNSLLSEIYYGYDVQQIASRYLHAVNACFSLINLVEEGDLMSTLKISGASLIFEGAQGILLDMDHGFFPHVTRSYTTCKNAMEIIRRNRLSAPSLFYVTRSYQTRHGAGPMTNESLIPELQHTEQETNVQNTWQGSFRRAVLDLDQLQYALSCDYRFCPQAARHLVVTCLDQTGPLFPATCKGALHHVTPEELVKIVLPEAGSFFTSTSACADHMIETIRETGPVGIHHQPANCDWPRSMAERV